MKSFKLYICVFITFLIFIGDVNSQPCSDCFCGTVGNSSSGEDTLFGGRYKPSRSDIGGAPSNEDYFKVLIVFVQFADEPYSNSSNPDAWNSGQAPNYINQLISDDRISNTNWWNSYNGYAVSDYWHEFSHGRLHVTGRAESIVLPESTEWYEANGSGPRVNRDVYDILKTRLRTSWKEYDNWKFNSEGEFT